MLRRDFLMVAAAGLAAGALPAYADPSRPFQPDLWPPMARRSDFVAWMAANRGEETPLCSASASTAMRRCSPSTTCGPQRINAPS